MSSDERPSSSQPELRLADLPVSDISGKLFVPAYQRGYRWGRLEVRQLLDDVTASGGERYYLQPIVVKRMPDGRLELIDGQQRLTTLHLILLYIRRENLLPSAETRYTLEYETRPGSRSYLEEPDEELHDTNIDFFHIWTVYKAIGEWFAEKDHKRLKTAIDFFSALDEKVRVIWYEVGAAENGPALFTRLNVGRIPLTDAELVKALLLSKSRTTHVRTDRAQEMVAQWDGIERDLRDPLIWSFITGEATEDPTHISLLLDTLARRDPQHDPAFHTYETLRRQVEETSPEEVWSRIVDLHSLVLGWYDDRNLYHWVGYLIATGTSFSQLVDLARDRRRSEFESMLRSRIASQLGLTEAALREVTYARSDVAEAALLLMNVETVRRTVGSTERYSFREHAAGTWSLEHIHAQNAERLNRADQWSEWLRLHGEALSGMPDLDPKARNDLLARIDDARSDVTEAKFRVLEQELIDVFSTGHDAETTDIHSIANLALLDRGVNSALSNSFFEVKRRDIIAADKEGFYIPVCTRHAFLKYYTPAEAQQSHFWSLQDRESYLNEVVRVLEPYLLPPDEADPQVALTNAMTGDISLDEEDA